MRDDDGDEDMNNESRSPSEVACRSLALLAVIDRVYRKPPDDIRHWAKTHEIQGHFSDEEAQFFFSDTPSEKQMIQFSWRSETLAVLLWSLGKLKKLPSLKKKVDLSKISGISDLFSAPDEFVASATLRDENEIYDLEEKMCDVHWKVRDAQLNSKKLPRNVDPGIVQERRYGTCWLLGFGEDWDDVPTDT